MSQQKVRSDETKNARAKCRNCGNACEFVLEPYLEDQIAEFSCRPCNTGAGFLLRERERKQEHTTYLGLARKRLQKNKSSFELDWD